MTHNHAADSEVPGSAGALVQFGAHSPPTHCHYTWCSCPGPTFCFVLFGLQLSVCLCWRLVPLRVLSDALLKRRNGAPAPRWLREEPLAPKCPPTAPTLNEVRCPGIADPVIHGQASAVLEPTPHVSGLSGDIVEIFWPPCAPVHPKWSAYQGAQVLLGDTPWRCAHHRALSRRDHLLVNAPSSVRPVDVHVLSVRSVVCA